MPSSTTYASLLADLIEKTEERSDEFMANLDGIIADGEIRCLRALDLECFQEEISVGNLVIGTREKARPASVVHAKDLFITVASSRLPLDKRTWGYAQLYAPVAATTGTPVIYVEKDDGDWYFVPTPDATYAITAYGIARPTGLGPTTSTTWLSTYCGDLLLLACLIEAEEFLDSDILKGKWEKSFGQKLADAKLELRGLSRADYLMSLQSSQAVRSI